MPIEKGLYYMKHLIDLNSFGASWINPNMASAITLEEKSYKERPWLCKIMGRAKDFKGYDREFVNCKPITKVMSGFDILLYNWKLERGIVYEYRNFMCDFQGEHFAHGFFVVENIPDQNCIRCLSKKEVNKLIFGRRKKK